MSEYTVADARRDLELGSADAHALARIAARVAAAEGTRATRVRPSGWITALHMAVAAIADHTAAECETHARRQARTAAELGDYDDDAPLDSIAF